MRAVVIALSMLFIALAGCGDNPVAAPPVPSTPVVGADGNVTGCVMPACAVAPVWTVGQAWQHRWFIGQNDTEGNVLPVVVAEDRGSTWALASQDELTAALHAAFILPTLGEFAKSSLDASVGQYNWPWYHFPMTEGATWNGIVYSPDDEGNDYTMDLEFKATADPAIAFMGKTAPGFHIIGSERGAGTKVIETDYVPELGWFAHLSIFQGSDSVDAAPGSLAFRIETEGNEPYHGTAYTSTGGQLANVLQVVSPAGGEVNLSPYSSFVMDETSTHLLAFPFAFAAGGVAAVEVLDPNGQRYEAQAIGVPESGSAGGLIFVPAVVGEWKVVNIPAGVIVAGSGLLAYGVNLQTLNVA